MPEKSTNAAAKTNKTSTKEKEDKFYYELLFLVGGNVAETDVPKINDKAKKEIEKLAGKVIGENSLGKKRLAYPIEDNSFGYYMVLEFNLDIDKLNELDDTLKLNQDILRHQIVKLPVGYKEKLIARTPVKPATETSGKKEEEKVGIEELDKKLDELLEKDLTS
ncbi:30S ribosomal protein S6 [bacterium]|nr:30S ribosomal protein S6 [bacterium]|tara:strand:- start:224 stop:715 length:492 start_codon:yes stop_codon:yes gene_type:complete